MVLQANQAEGAVCALIAGSPTIGFLGYAVLDPLYGTGVETGLVIAIVAIVVNAVTIRSACICSTPAAAATSPQTANEGNALLSALKAVVGPDPRRSDRRRRHRTPAEVDPTSISWPRLIPASPSSPPASRCPPTRSNSTGKSLIIPFSSLSDAGRVPARGLGLQA